MEFFYFFIDVYEMNQNEEVNCQLNKKDTMTSGADQTMPVEVALEGILAGQLSLINR